MKKLLQILVLFIAAQGFSQSSQLVNTTWYLTNFIQNGNSSFPVLDPVNLPSVNLYFIPDGENFTMLTSVCNNCWAENVTFNDANNTFSYSQSSVSLGTCPGGVNSSFDSNYLGFYHFSNNQAKSYAITNNSGILNLIVTKANGDSAHYSTQNLGRNDVIKDEISVYPNPTKNILYLNAANHQDKPSTIKIYDVTGQCIFSRSDNSLPSTLDLSSYAPGIYIVSITTDEQVSTFKILKN